MYLFYNIYKYILFVKINIINIFLTRYLGIKNKIYFVYSFKYFVMNYL